MEPTPTQPVTLTIQGALTFKADGIFSCQLSTKNAKADQVGAGRVNIESGAQFDFQPIANKRLTSGRVFILLSNSSTKPIAGAFSNLPDGSTFSAATTASR